MMATKREIVSLMSNCAGDEGRCLRARGRRPDLQRELATNDPGDEDQDGLRAAQQKIQKIEKSLTMTPTAICMLEPTATPIVCALR